MSFTVLLTIIILISAIKKHNVMKATMNIHLLYDIIITGDGEAIRIVGVSIMGCLFLRGTQQHIILQKIGKN